MSAPMTADRFLEALLDEGLTVVQVGDWRNHNRNHMGAWGSVHGVMIHHTVTKGTNTATSRSAPGPGGPPLPRRCPTIRGSSKPPGAGGRRTGPTCTPSPLTHSPGGPMLDSQLADVRDLIAGADPARPLDLLLINAPLRDYTLRPRLTDYTLPVIGMGYIATYAAQAGHNVGLLDAEAHGLGVEETIRLANRARPCWVGLNLLAPTYELSARIAAGLDDGVQVMVGGHHAKAAPETVLADPRMSRLAALVVGETRVTALLDDAARRAELPGVMWRDRLLGTTAEGIEHDPARTRHWLSPDIDGLPMLDRAFLPQDPYVAGDGRREANMVGARGCPYDCFFCGAAVSKTRI